ncbi:unnamed protein product [Nyctereutes procyonoides]|uniref:(raccoon dog) hypothetical protein n=1 Tax=Nyctereutes procyonoides TaxID=34880 RepID=A0A811YCW0_NYCPR|nr:unnamed protein product [Nyctereutes procyonoides]
MGGSIPASPSLFSPSAPLISEQTQPSRVVLRPAAAEPGGPLGPARSLPGVGVGWGWGARRRGGFGSLSPSFSPTPSAAPSLTSNNLLASPGLCFPGVGASRTPGSRPGPSWVPHLTPPPRPGPAPAPAPAPARSEAGVKGSRVTWSPSSPESAGRAEGEPGEAERPGPRSPGPPRPPGPPGPRPAPPRPRPGALAARPPARRGLGSRSRAGTHAPSRDRAPLPRPRFGEGETEARDGKALAPRAPLSERHVAPPGLPRVLRPVAQHPQEALTPWGHFFCAQDHVGLCHGDIKGRGGRKERDRPADCAPGWEEGPGARIFPSCYPPRAALAKRL